MSHTKAKFYEGYKKPMPAVYNTVIQELLVQQHLIRFNKKYQYDEVSYFGCIYLRLNHRHATDPKSTRSGFKMFIPQSTT